MRRAERFVPYRLLAPALAVELLLVLGPLVVGVWYSLHNVRFFRVRNFTGLDNYWRVLGSEEVLNALRYDFRGRTAAMMVIVAVMSIPIASLLVPTFTLISVLGLFDTRLGLVLLYTAYQLPAAIWMLYGYFMSLPVEVENAARVDGCTPLATLRKVVLPLSKPGLVAAALFILVFAWNDFVVAVTMTSSEATRTFPVAIYFYLGFYGREWGPLLAASLVSIVPIIAVFVFLQRYFMSGLTGGGVKG
ncbi:carbohydrate ABC transporter permease [Falsiroseomonas sp.]|uniref:carbohydrate ABC transporter permease n=1 Tax=Falsiroseomonas sp. TaxID=2870721 RepID=UPI00356523D7